MTISDLKIYPEDIYNAIKNSKYLPKIMQNKLNLSI